MALEKKHTECFTVRPAETDFRGWLSFGALAGFLQDTAGMHANKLGFGVGDLLRRNMTWMLSRFRLEVLRRIDCGERLSVTTWPSGSERLFTNREFTVTDDQGRLAAKATTAWLTIEVKPDSPARKILRPQKELEPHYLLERVFDGTLDKILLPESFSFSREFAVRKGQIDVNLHANNLAYVEWITESVPDDVYFNRDCTGIEINFTAEILSGEQGKTLVFPEDGGSSFLHRILRCGALMRRDGSMRTESEDEICRARTCWGNLPKPQA